MIYEENSVIIVIKKTIGDIITIFGTGWDIHLGIIVVKFGAILPQTIWVIEIFLLLWIFVISTIINTKTLKINNKFIINLHICRIYWR